MPSLYLNEHQLEIVSGTTAEYPYSIHVTDISEYTIPWHWHEEVEFNYMKEGSIRITTTNNEYEIHEDEAYFVNANVLDMKEPVPEEGKHAVEVAHLFHPVLLSGHFQSRFEKKYMNPILQNRQLEVVVFKKETENGRKMLKILKDTARLQNSDDNEFQTRNMLSEAWLLLTEELKENAGRHPRANLANQERIRFMITYIHRHYAEKISLSQIAESANIGEREALRCFQKTLKRTPFDYLNEYRLNKARKLLKESSLPVTEIAMKTGFSDSAYFGKVFRKSLGMTPKEYRNLHK